jgi:hypothetical protein
MPIVLAKYHRGETRGFQLLGRAFAAVDKHGFFIVQLCRGFYTHHPLHIAPRRTHYISFMQKCPLS